jgi:hypothetical protein
MKKLKSFFNTLTKLVFNFNIEKVIEKEIDIAVEEVKREINKPKPKSAPKKPKPDSKKIKNKK